MVTSQLGFPYRTSRRREMVTSQLGFLYHMSGRREMETTPARLPLLHVGES
jgi:hypothetical protein